MVMWIVRLIQIRFVIGAVDSERTIQISTLALLHLSLCGAAESTALLQPDPCLASVSMQMATEGLTCRVRKGQAGAKESCPEGPMLSNVFLTPDQYHKYKFRV